MLWKNIDAVLFEDEDNFYYIGNSITLSIEKKNAFKLNSSNFVKVLKNVPRNLNKISDPELSWTYNFLFENKNPLGIHVIDYGFKEEAYGALEFLNSYIHYETGGVVVNKTNTNSLDITYASDNYFNAFKLINAYLDYTEETINLKKKIKDEIDLIIFLKESNNIKIELTPTDYKIIRTVRVNLTNNFFF